MEDLKRLGGCKSETAANGYVTHSKSSKEKICEKIISSINLPGPSATSTSTSPQPAASSITKVTNSTAGSSSTTSWPDVTPTKASAGSNSRPNVDGSLDKVPSTVTGDFYSANRSVLNSEESKGNKENSKPLENQML
ncbi:putative protein TPRXL, partial [Diachasma alloeum]|uniref:putative protein TPRXL n=1 Tax=Diachasma alloeum TaxID=454923 RepID=UPI0007385059